MDRGQMALNIRDVIPKEIHQPIFNKRIQMRLIPWQKKSDLKITQIPQNAGEAMTKVGDSVRGLIKRTVVIASDA